VFTSRQLRSWIVSQRASCNSVNRCDKSMTSGPTRKPMWLSDPCISRMGIMCSRRLLKLAYGSPRSEMFIPDDADACPAVSLDRKANWRLACYMREIRFTHRNDSKKHNSHNQIQDNCHDLLPGGFLGNGTACRGRPSEFIQSRAIDLGLPAS
jgi:hypothetical protein